MVTVVDTVNLLGDYASHDFLKDRGQEIGSDDQRTLVDLLVDQIEFADVVILNGPLPGVLRAKGHFWIATRPDWLAEFSLAGAISSVRLLGRWRASVPEERRPDHPEARAYLARHWQEPFGDRRQELVFVGAGMDKSPINSALDGALIKPTQWLAPEEWAGMADPFPEWQDDPRAA